jgi:hypothetical protein
MDCPTSGASVSKRAGKHDHEGAAVEAFVSLRFCRSSGVMGQAGYTGAKGGGACEQAQAVP